MRIGVLTSGGDAPGMNAAIRAIVRYGLARGADMLGITRGFAGLTEGGGAIHRIRWDDVAHIASEGGTVLGTARCPAFLTGDGRREAVFNLVNAGIDHLIVIGGDGSLTGAELLAQEWPRHLADLIDHGRIDEERARAHPKLHLVALPGSIDNDLWGTDCTIGYDTALHRIVDAVDALASTARSHRRAFVVEVMGRRSGALALAAAVCTGADVVFLPEDPPEDWRTTLTHRLHPGMREAIVLVAEGARDRSGEPIRTEAIRDMLEQTLSIEARTTVLGHIQRGGPPSACDRLMPVTLGIHAVRLLLDGLESPTMLGMAGPAVRATPLDEALRKTRTVHATVEDGRYQAAINARGDFFLELIHARGMVRTSLSATAARTIALAHVGAPAPGMNAAIATFVDAVRAAGHEPLLIRDGLRGVLEGRFERPDALDGLLARGATVLGTDRWRPHTAGELSSLRKAIAQHGIEGLVLVGGFGALEAASGMRIPCAVVPATISNNVPGTEISVGADTALNAICEAIDRLKLSALGSRNRVFFVEVMGRRCGYLARAAGLATGAEFIYTDEDPPTLARIYEDAIRLNAAMDEGRTVAIVLVADGVRAPFRAERLAELFAEASEGRYDTRVCVLGHLQQGGRPSPADRLLAVRLTRRAVAEVLGGCGRRVVGLAHGRVQVERVVEALEASDREARRPGFQHHLPRLRALKPRKKKRKTKKSDRDVR